MRGLFVFDITPEQRFLMLFFLADTVKARFHLLVGEHKLGCREYRDFVKPVNGALAVRVKALYLIYLVPEKFYPHGHIVIQRENVKNAAAHGKIAGGVHLLLPLVSERHEFYGKRFLFDHVTDLKLYDVAFYPVKREDAVHEGIKAHHYDRRFSGCKAPYYAHPVFYDGVSVHVSAVENEVFCGIEIHILRKKLHVLIHFAGSEVVVGDKKSALEIWAQRGNKMTLFGVRNACERYGRVLSEKCRLGFVIFC